MIVTESTPRSKDAAPASSPGGTSNSIQPLPPPPPYAAHAAHPTDRPILSTGAPGPRRRTVKRFIEALGIALLICFLFGLLSGSMDRLNRFKAGHTGKTGWHNSADEWRIPSEFHSRECTERGDWFAGTSGLYPYSSSTSFYLPVSSDSLFLLSRGPLASGSVQILQTEQAGDVARVNVTMGHYRVDAADSARVCVLTRRAGENGVGIFTPPAGARRSLKENLYFHVTLQLPASSGSSPLLIKKLSTDLPNFSHEVGWLSETVEFEKIHLKGSNRFICVESLSAETAELETSKSPIEGSFNASASLSLITSNGHVNINVGLYNDNASRGTRLTVQTSNGWVRSAISLLSSNTVTNGQYDISTKTSNGALDVEFPVSPVNSTLHLEAKTSNSPARITLDSAYEGVFSARSSNNISPALEQLELEDPSGGRRPRVVERTAGRGYVKGRVHYHPSGKASSWVDAQTSNGQLVLKL